MPVEEMYKYAKDNGNNPNSNRNADFKIGDRIRLTKWQGGVEAGDECEVIGFDVHNSGYLRVNSITNPSVRGKGVWPFYAEKIEPKIIPEPVTKPTTQEPIVIPHDGNVVIRTEYMVRAQGSGNAIHNTLVQPTTNKERVDKFATDAVESGKWKKVWIEKQTTIMVPWTTVWVNETEHVT